MSLNTTQLITKLPQSWWGLFGAMRSRQPQAVEVWFQNQTKSRYGCLADWESLLRELCTEEPISSSSGLEYRCRFVQLPDDVQCHLLSFLLQHREEVQPKSLETFVSITKLQIVTDSWSDVLLRSLSAYVQLQTCEKQNLLDVPYQFSSCNKGRADSLCEELKTENRVIPWTCSVELHESIGAEKKPENVDIQTVSEHFVVLESNINERSSVNTDNHSNKRVTSSGDSLEIIVLDDEEEEKDMETPDHKKRRISFEICEPINKLNQLSQQIDMDSNFIVKGEKLKEVWLSGLDQETPTDLDLFIIASPKQVEKICKVLEFDSLTDTALGMACQHLSTLSSIISHSNCLQFLSAAVYPKVSELNQSSLRQLAGVISLAAEKFPKPVIDGVFIKCFQLQQLGALQADLLCKLIKETLTNTCNLYLLETKFSLQEDNFVTFPQVLLPRNKVGEDITFCPQIIKNLQNLDDSAIYVIQTLIEDKVQLTVEVIRDLLKSLLSHSTQHEKNLKFGRLIMAILNKYSHQFTDEDKETLTLIVQTHGTFLKKSLVTCLKKLK